MGPSRAVWDLIWAFEGPFVLFGVDDNGDDDDDHGGGDECDGHGDGDDVHAPWRVRSLDFQSLNQSTPPLYSLPGGPPRPE